jgi:O-antigen/teichoic acid export membrane protein
MDGVAPDHQLPSGFAERVRAAVFWRWGSQVLAQIVTWTATIVIVRLLNPDDYGLFAMTQTLLTALNFLNGYSYATSLIQAKEVDDRQIGQVFGLLLISNILLAAVQLISAPYAAAYYGQPLVATMLRVQALLYLATPFIALPSALLARQLDFRRQALVNLLSAALGSVVGLYLAWRGFGVWALVWAPISAFAARALGLTLAAKTLVRPIFDFRGARDIVGFGTALTLCQLFWIIQSQADIVIAGRSFTPHALGLYSEALFFTLIMTSRFLPPLNEVAFPAYAELHNSGQPIASAFLASARMIMLVAAPFYVGLSLTAGPLVATFFGPKWLEMIPIVATLAIAMPAMALQIVCSPATNALGRPGLYLFGNIAGAIIMPVCFLYGAARGAQGLADAWHVAAPLLLIVTLGITLPAIGARVIDLVKALLPIGVACAVMAVAVLALDSITDNFPAPLRLALLSLIGAVVYGGVLQVVWPAILTDAWAMVRKPAPPEARESGLVPEEQL